MIYKKYLNYDVYEDGKVYSYYINGFLKGDITKLAEMPWSENTAVSLIRFDEDLNPQVVFCNDTSHLPEGLIPKRSRLSSFMGGNTKAGDKE